MKETTGIIVIIILLAANFAVMYHMFTIGDYEVLRAEYEITYDGLKQCQLSLEELKR